MARPPVGLFSAGAAVLAFHVAGGHLVVWQSVPILFSLFAMTSAGFVLNDYFDVAKDKLNGVQRPLPLGLVSRRAALSEAVILFASALAAAATLGPPLLALAATNALLLIAYSPLVQRIHGVLANLVVAYLCASALLFGALAAGRPYSALPAMIFVFGITLAREIVFDVADAHGDRATGLMTLPTAYGAAVAFGVAWLVLAATAAASIGAVVVGVVSVPGVFLASSAAAIAMLAAGLYIYQRRRDDGSYALFGVVISHLSFVFGGVVIYSGRFSAADDPAGNPALVSFDTPDGAAIGGFLAILIVSSMTLSKYNK
jgi:4-hydroxybenzoate polyprenyltransferase